MAILNEKRETKRYYIRPQNIFCANKADVLKGLIQVAENGENCTVYSLKNLKDHDDVHQLTNHDIIYYYDDNVLYDKNHVLVMDYDLFIKHEEERKRINRDPETFTKQDFDRHYEDRMTKETVTESNHLAEGMEYSTYGFKIQNVPDFATTQKYIVARFTPDDDGLWYYGAWNDKEKAIACARELNSYDNSSTAQVIPNTNLASWDPALRTFKENYTESFVDDHISEDVFKLAIERGEKVDLGQNQADADVVYVEDEPYSETVYYAGKDNSGYYINSVLIGVDGAQVEDKHKVYDSYEDLLNGIQAIDWTSGNKLVDLQVINPENPFDQTFESYDVFGKKLTEAKEEDTPEFCCICGEPIEGYGNNAEPYKAGYCCDACNYKFVIPARLNIIDVTEESEK